MMSTFATGVTMVMADRPIGTMIIAVAVLLAYAEMNTEASIRPSMNTASAST